MLGKNKANLGKSNYYIKEKKKLSFIRINTRKEENIKIKAKLKKNFIFFNLKYRFNFLVLLLIQMLITPIYSEEDISSKYEITIVFSGSGNISILNDDFKIWPSYLEVNSDIINVTKNMIYNLIDDESHIAIMRFNTEIKNCSNMFKGLSNLKKVSFRHFDFSKVVDMSGMFYGCTNLRTIYFRNPDTSHVTNMKSMFDGCEYLNGLDLTQFSTISVSNMNYMFYNCRSLTSLDLSNFNTDKVTNMNLMFYYCNNLAYLNISSFNTSQITDMNSMFYECTKLTSLNLTNFNTSLVTNMDLMFYYCSSLRTLDITSFDTSKIQSMKKMFYYCRSLKSLDLRNFNTELIQDMSYMFYECNSLRELDLSNFNTEKTIDMQYMFSDCSSLTSLNLSNFNTQNVKYMYSIFYDCISLESLDISNFNLQSLEHSFSFLQNRKNLKFLNMKNFNATNVQSMENAFLNLTSLISLDISNIYTPSLKYMQYMFCNCSLIEYLDLSSFNTENVVNMKYMFTNCTHLKYLDLSNFDTKNATNMSYMFYNCQNLQSLNLSNFNATKVTHMHFMFHNCLSLKLLDISNFNTINVLYMQNMFYGCGLLESIDLSSFKTYNVINMTYMFYNCKSLKSLDLSSFNTANTYYISKMIYNCDKLTSLDISNFNLKNVYGPNYETYTSYFFRKFDFLTNLKSLQYLSMTNVDASNFDNFYRFFYNLYNLVSIDLSNFKTSSATKMSSMFYNCTSLKFLNLTSFFTKNVEYMDYMFYNCKSLQILDLSSFNTEIVSSTSYIFSGCSSLKSLDVSNFNLRNIGSFNFLKNLYSLQYLNLKNFKANIRDLSYSFYNLVSLISIDLSNADMSSVTNMDNFFYSCSTIQSIDLSNLNFGSVLSMRYMFNNCFKLQFVNLGNLNTKYLESMGYMFNNCHNLQSINFTNFNTSFVKDLDYMFNNCSLISSIDLSNFDTSSVTTMSGMFYNCPSLEYVNMKNINTNSLETMRNMFYNCINLKNINFFSITDNNIVFRDIFENSSGNFSYCIKDETKVLPLFNILVSLNKTKRDCSLECYNHDMKLIESESKCIIDCSKNEYNRYEYDYECYESCPKRSYLPNNSTYTCEDLICEKYYDYEQRKCIDEIPEGYFLNDSELKTIDKCHPNCKTCDKKEDENSENCISCPELNYLFYGNCVSHCENGFYIDEEDNNITKCKCENKKCFKCSKESLNNDLCISCNDNYYQILNDKNNREPYINCYKDPEGYYLDTNDSYYKECYKTCKTCYGEGDEFDNKCNECRSAYSLKYNNNCLIKCTYNYYIDQFGDFHCTRTEKCTNEFNKLIKSKKRCVEDCKIDDTFKYEFQSKCYEECPLEAKPSENDEFYCSLDCPEDKPYEIIKTQECVESCTTSQILRYLCVLNNKNVTENSELKETLITGLLDSYLTGEIDESLENDPNGITYNNENLNLQIINYDFQETTEGNTTNIRLGECEKKLREYYNISEEESLIIFKVETYEEGLKMPLIQYKLYSGKDRTDLDISICEGIKINLLVPVEINEEELYKYYLDSEYYNNLCFTYTTKNKTDIPLKDRQKEFINNKMALCEENCDFDEYNNNTKKASCKCNVKNYTDSSNKNFDMQAFYNYFTNFTGFSNLEVMKCYRNLFTKNGILNNYGSFIILPIILFNIISFIIFNFRDSDLIKEKIREIVNFKKIYDSLNKKKNNINEIGQNAENKNNNDWNNREKNNNKVSKIKRETVLAGEKWSVTNEKETNKEIKEYKEIKEDKLINISVNSPTKKIIKRKKVRYSINVLKTNGIISNLTSNKLDLSKSKNYLQKEKIIEKNTSFLEKNLKIKPNIPYISYNDLEMNSLLYEEALKYDKRSYFQYYLSLIRIKHILLFVFHSSDYNSKLIKINLFFFSFATYFAIIALFFDDGTLHQIYMDGGKYDFIYQIPKKVYSSLLTSIIDTLIRHLSLSQMSILEIKREKNIYDLDKKVLKIEKCLSYKFAIFFRLNLVFLLFFWYYISCFCVVYRNTQLLLLKDTLIGFSICLIYPFGLYLIPGIFRIPSLKSSKKNMKFFYKFSKLIQLVI